LFTEDDLKWFLYGFYTAYVKCICITKKLIFGVTSYSHSESVLQLEQAGNTTFAGRLGKVRSAGFALPKANRPDTGVWLKTA